MIDEAIAKKQLNRMAGLDYFPKEVDAIKELRMALQAAETVEIAESVVAEWIAMQREAPKPADLRRLVHDRNSQIERGGCSECQGSRWVTVWILVTYAAGYTVDHKKTQILRGFDFEKARDFAEKIAASGANQTVLSAAVACHCAKYARGEQAA